MSDFFNNFIGKNKNFIDRNKKVFLLLISILVVITVFLNSTYSLLFKEDVTDLQSYTTGVLQLTSNTINNSVTLTNSLPMNDTDGLKSTPYDFKITNTGNLAFKFDVKLLSTDTTNQIDSQYIKVSVNGGNAVTLSSLTEGKILENITLDSGKNTEVSLRVWLSEDTPNSQIGKVFNAKIVTEGYAIYTSDSVQLPSIDYVTPDISDFTYEFAGDSYYSDTGMPTDSVLLTSYNGTDENIRIPETYTINGTTYDVVLFSDDYDGGEPDDAGVFEGNTVIKNVYIEESVEIYTYSGGLDYSYLSDDASYMFYNSGYLETVVIENPNIKVAEYMFDYDSTYDSRGKIEVYVPVNSTTYETLNNANIDGMLSTYGTTEIEIIPFGGNSSVEQVTPYTDFTYWLGDENPTVSSFVYNYNGIDVSIPLDNLTLGANEILLYKYSGSSQTVNIPDTYIIDGTIYNTKIISLIDIAYEDYGSAIVDEIYAQTGIFYGNTNITNVDVGSNVESIKIYADTYGGGTVTETNASKLFMGCTNLTTVTSIPVNVTDITGMFNGCTSLTGDIRIESQNVSKANILFSGTSKTINVYVPVGSTTYNTINALTTSNGKPSNIILNTY